MGRAVAVAYLKIPTFLFIRSPTYDMEDLACNSNLSDIQNWPTNTTMDDVWRKRVPLEKSINQSPRVHNHIIHVVLVEYARRVMWPVQLTKEWILWSGNQSLGSWTRRKKDWIQFNALSHAGCKTCRVLLHTISFTSDLNTTGVYFSNDIWVNLIQPSTDLIISAPVWIKSVSKELLCYTGPG